MRGLRPALQRYVDLHPALPYILTIIVLAGAIGRAIPPAADGAVYEPDPVRHGVYQAAIARQSRTVNTSPATRMRTVPIGAHRRSINARAIPPGV